MQTLKVTNSYIDDDFRRIPDRTFIIDQLTHQFAKELKKYITITEESNASDVRTYSATLTVLDKNDCVTSSQTLYNYNGNESEIVIRSNKSYIPNYNEKNNVKPKYFKYKHNPVRKVTNSIGELEI